MRVIILTSSLGGTAAHHLPYLLKSPGIEVAAVVYSHGKISKKKLYYNRKLQKVFKIGILGALNGIRIRKWFNIDLKDYVAIGDILAICEESATPFYETPSINCARTRELFELSFADVGISIGNGYIGKSVFSIPKLGMINIHHEILPAYQNAQSVIWQLYNGSRETGYTIHKIDKNIDTGEILLQEKIPIIFENTLARTVAHTSAVLLKASAIGLVNLLENFHEYFLTAKPQGKGESYTTPSFLQYIRIYYQYKKLREKE